MKKFFLTLSVMALSLCAMASAKNDKPNIYILATGGTIAGSGSSSVGSAYSAGAVAIDALIAAVPQMSEIANIRGEQVVKIGSQDMSDEIMLTIAKRVNALLVSDSVDGVVITHGTDTMEETAYFLTLTVKSDKPIVLVGAMRPSTSISADGEMNLYNAVLTAKDKDSYGKGVLVAMNGRVYDAKGVTKTNTTSVETFTSPNSGAIGVIYNNDVEYSHTPNYRHTMQSTFDISRVENLPKVGIVYGHSSVDRVMVDALIANNYKGIVFAGVGNGNIHKNVMPALEEAVDKGIAVVRSSRTPSGATTLFAEIDDTKYGFVASQWLNPQKARILLMLSLLNGVSVIEKTQQIFNQY